MKVDIKMLEEKLEQVSTLKRLVKSEDFGAFLEVFKILEYKALSDIKTSYTKEEKDMRSAVAFYAAIQEIKGFVFNVENDYNLLQDKISQIKRLQAEEERKSNENRASNGIINR